MFLARGPVCRSKLTAEKSSNLSPRPVNVKIFEKLHNTTQESCQNTQPRRWREGNWVIEPARNIIKHHRHRHDDRFCWLYTLTRERSEALTSTQNLMKNELGKKYIWNSQHKKSRFSCRRKKAGKKKLRELFADVCVGARFGTVLRRHRLNLPVEKSRFAK